MSAITAPLRSPAVAPGHFVAARAGGRWRGNPRAALHAALVDAGDLSSLPLGLREDLSGSEDG